MKKITIFVLCSLLFTTIFAQRKERNSQKQAEKKERINQLIKQEEEGALIFHKQSIFGIKLHTDGYSAFYELGKLKTPVKTNIYTIEIGERKHPKEEKLTRGNLGFTIGNPFVYGKINNFYYTKLGIGQQRLIGGKGNKNGVAVSALYGGGLSLGFLKPYYIEISNASSNTVKDIKYDNNDSVFLDPSNINGASSFGKGFKEMTFVPGAYARTGLRFDYGRYNELVNALEVGLNVEFYSKKMPIMLLNKEKRFFYSAYVAINFGRRK